MAISNMQQARQLRAGGGIMTIPRQNYGLGKLVKKAGRALKKVAKSPIGKAALLYAGGTMLGGSTALGGAGGSFMSRLANPSNLMNLKNILGTKTLPGLKGVGGEGIGRFFNPFNRANPLFFKDGDFSGKRALITGGIGASLLPFLTSGEEDEEEIVESFSETPSSITDIVAMARARDPSLRFLPQNAYTQAGFFNAAGGGLADIPREGYQMGGPTDDVMVENIDTQEVVSAPDPMAELNMLSIELFGKPLNQLNETEKEQLQNLIQSRMQEQPRVMAESGGMMDFMSSANPMAQSYLMTDEDVINMYKPGKERTYAAKGGIMSDMPRDGYRVGGGVMSMLQKAGSAMKNLKNNIMTKLSRMTDDVEIQTASDYAEDTGASLDIFITPKTKKGKDTLDNLVEEGLMNVDKGGTYTPKFGYEDVAIRDMDKLKVSGVIEEGDKFTRFDEGAGIGEYGVPYYGYDELIETFGRKKRAEGGIMDLGGKEKDYRTGGFVDLGAEERADDVPARLSKNEFVFTADAVRNAGGGDIDKGAEVMDRMMTNLEQGGEVSEESQGMNPAQEMFDTAQMLESRIA